MHISWSLSIWGNNGDKNNIIVELESRQISSSAFVIEKLKAAVNAGNVPKRGQEITSPRRTVGKLGWEDLFKQIYSVKVWHLDTTVWKTGIQRRLWGLGVYTAVATKKKVKKKRLFRSPGWKVKKETFTTLGTVLWLKLNQLDCRKQTASIIRKLSSLYAPLYKPALLQFGLTGLKKSQLCLPQK